LRTLVAEDRIYWKSHVGLPEDLMAARESPRETSLCGHVVAADNLMVVPDLAADPRFANNPTVRERGLRFYAGAPLRTTNGYPIGTLCLLDTKPRYMREGEKRYLQMTADKLMSEIEARAATAVPA
jgi:GAF domain-containing protein